MIVRIAISPSYGYFQIPSKFQEEIDKQDKNFRLTIAECIDKLENTHDNLTVKEYEELCNSKSKWYVKSDNIFYFKDLNDIYNTVHDIEIVEVDTEKQWKITEYDGAENIVYFTEPKVIDKEINMCEWW